MRNNEQCANNKWIIIKFKQNQKKKTFKKKNYENLKNQTKKKKKITTNANGLLNKLVTLY